MSAPKYVQRIARLPEVFAQLMVHPGGLRLTELATEVGVPVDELREDLLAFYTADLNPMLFGLSRPSVLTVTTSTPTTPRSSASSTSDPATSSASST